jgi:hypothetical protein
MTQYVNTTQNNPSGTTIHTSQDCQFVTDASTPLTNTNLDPSALNYCDYCQNQPGYNLYSSIQDYCEYHGLERTLIPVPSRKLSEWRVLQTVTDWFNDLAEYGQTTRYSRLYDTQPDVLPGTPTGLVREYMWMQGAFPVDQGSGKWSNPGWAHSHANTTKKHNRRTHVEKAIRYPTIGRRELAERDGVTKKAISNWMHANDIAYRQGRRESRKRIGRSILATAEWSEWSIRECCMAFPRVPFSTLRDWVYVEAREDGWEVPVEPTDTKWYPK